MNIRKVYLVIFIVFIFVTALFAGVAEAGLISGKLVTDEGRPMADAMVFFFNDKSGPPPSPDKYWRIPDHVLTVNGEGRFAVDLAEGNYYIGVVPSGSWQHDGPPRGENFLFLGQKPDGGLTPHPVRNGEETDLGIISESELFKMIDSSGELTSTIEGFILNDDGIPAEKAIAFAYPAPGTDTKPLFVSDSTDEDGRYTLRLHEGGTYYLKARFKYKASSSDEEKPLAVTVKTGETISGILLNVK